MNTEELLRAVMTVVEVAEVYPIGTDAVRKAIRRQQLPARKANLGPKSMGVWLISRADVERMWGHGKRKPGRKLQITAE